MRSHFVFTCSLIFLLLCGCLAQIAESQVRPLAELSVSDIQGLDHSQTVVVIPAGLFEEHGPYLPAFTDGYYNERLAIEVAEAIVSRTKRPVVLFPTIPLGVGSPEDFGGRKPYSGSYTVRPATLRAMFMDLADALGNDGFRWIFILDSHGSPSHNRALIEAGNYFHDSYNGVMVPLTSYRYSSVANRPPIWTGDEEKENAGDVHGGADETSRILFLRPELVHSDYTSAKSETAPSDSDLNSLAKAPDWPGYFGSPRLGSAAAGAQLVHRGVEDITDLAIRVLNGFDANTLPNRGNPPVEAFQILV